MSILSGTGKTCTLIEAILQIFTNVENSKILVSTPSNSGANLITELLLKQHEFKQSDLIRLHSFNSVVKSKVSPNIMSHSAVVDTSYPGQTNDKDDFDFEYPTDHSVDNKIMIADILNYRVVITTCSMMGCFQMRPDCKPKFSHVIVDEAGQCIEPEALIPIHFIDPKNGQVILAGDPKQLGPVVFSASAKNRNLGKSLLGRILDLPLYLENVQVFKNIANNCSLCNENCNCLCFHFTFSEFIE